MNGVVGLVVVGFILAICPILALISLFRRSDNEVAGNSRVLWALVILFIPFSCVVYFLIGRKSGSDRKSGIDRDW
jgi:H+/Cl- antiporter ClcA